MAVPWALPWVMIGAGCWYNPAAVGFVAKPPLGSIYQTNDVSNKAKPVQRENCVGSARAAV
jgi:hypothetical protein